MVVYGVKGYFPNVPSSVFDQIYVVNNGRMVMQTDLDLHGHRLMNNNQGGFEIRDDGSIRCHGTFDLNGYRIDGVISFAAGEIFFAKKYQHEWACG